MWEIIATELFPFHVLDQDGNTFIVICQAALMTVQERIWIDAAGIYPGDCIGQGKEVLLQCSLVGAKNAFIFPLDFLINPVYHKDTLMVCLMISPIIARFSFRYPVKRPSLPVGAAPFVLGLQPRNLDHFPVIPAQVLTASEFWRRNMYSGSPQITE